MGLRTKRRLKKIDDQLPEVLALFANALRAGIALPHIIEAASTELEDPIRREFEVASDLMKGGCTVEDALEDILKRTPTADIELFVRSIEILRRMGGNLIETMDILSSTIHERRRVADKIRTQTAQGRYQCLVLLALPWALAAALHVAAPDYIGPLINTRIGMALVGLGIVLESIGAIWMKKIVDIDV